MAAYLLTRAGFPNVLLALIIGMMAAAAVGYLVDLITLRRTGIYFAMITVANGHIVHEGQAQEIKAQPEILHRYLGV